MTSRIVVGIDGSEHARVALDWAVAEAKLRGASLEMIMAWQPPPMYSGMMMPPYSDLEASARQSLDAVMVRAGLSAEGEPPTVASVAAGSAAPVLLEAAKHADLLVVGARGYGEFVGMAMGSVSLHCASHAPCPVVVVRSARTE